MCGSGLSNNNNNNKRRRLTTPCDIKQAGQSGALNERDEEITRLKKAIEEAHAESAAKDKAGEEIREQIRSAVIDLTNLTRENQAMSEACAVLRRERNAAAAQLEEVGNLPSLFLSSAPTNTT